MKKIQVKALRGFRATVFESLDEMDQRAQFRSVAPGELVYLAQLPAREIAAANKAEILPGAETEAPGAPTDGGKEDAAAKAAAAKKANAAALARAAKAGA